ncbi:hypothetical protein LTR84_002030 [Exophiala bonariae]|uniref:Uncharacterized protein n=1 Tax=Exophiala bonariae TaxID=1690606 RepID=A0AAV9NA43_9EURO|nr:hypothetical protein LTR84_002030 [Exophiala bonariae]
MHEGASLEEGALVATNYPHAELQAEVETVLTQIRVLNATHSQDAFAIEADLSTTTGPSELVAKVFEQSKRDKGDILINNAGLAIMTPIKAVTLEEWDKHINLNARGTFLLTQAVLPYLSKGSRIVNLSSSGARQPYMASSVYNGTKAMIESFTRCWAA